MSPDHSAMDQGKEQWWLGCTEQLWGLAAGACSSRGNCKHPHGVVGTGQAAGAWGRLCMHWHLQGPSWLCTTWLLGLTTQRVWSHRTGLRAHRHTHLEGLVQVVPGTGNKKADLIRPQAAQGSQVQNCSALAAVSPRTFIYNSGV